MRGPRLWGAILGLSIGASVVVASSLRYGFSFPLLVLGLVCAAGFGGLAFMGVGGRDRTELD